MEVCVRTRRLRRRFMALCGTVMAAFLALAAGQPAHAQSSILPLSQAQISKYVQRLNLTETQKPTVTAVMERSRREGEAVLKKHGVTGEPGKKPGLFQLATLSSDMTSTFNWARAEVSKVLTPVQMREFEKICAEGAAEIKRKLLR